MLGLETAWALDQGRVPAAESSMAKIFVSELAQRVADAGSEILGLAGQLHPEEPARRCTAACSGSIASRRCWRSAAAPTKCSATSSRCSATACRASEAATRRMQLAPSPEQQDLDGRGAALLPGADHSRAADAPGSGSRAASTPTTWAARSPDLGLVRPWSCRRRAGGSGLGLVEVACCCRSARRGLVPAPVINAIRAAMGSGAPRSGAPELAG